MQGKTHLIIGTTVTMAILQPDSFSELICGMTAAAIGSVVSDVDVKTSESSKSSTVVSFVVIALIALISFLESRFHLGLVKFILQRTNLFRIIMGLILALIIVVIGKTHSHRSFMHSFLALALMSIALAIMAPAIVSYFAVGFVSHLVLDIFNKKGEQLFYPADARIALGLCVSDGLANSVLFGIGNVALIITIAVLIIRIVVKG